MYTIIGKGFGLYGYLPAIMLLKKQLILPVDYKNFIEKRNEIRPYVNQIHWSKNIFHTIKKADYVVFAIPPLDQFNFLLNHINLLKNKTLFLEKPIANSPKNSLKLIELLENKKIKFYVNYSFIYLDWFEKIQKRVNLLNNNYQNLVDWRFKAYHLHSNIVTWKSNIELGGGIIRFYAIHLIAAFSFLNYKNCDKIILVRDSSSFLLKLTSVNRPSITIKIDIDSSEKKFLINVADNSGKLTERIVDYNDPFDFYDKKISYNLDRRVDYLRKYIQEKSISQQNISFNREVIRLWEKIEYMKK